MSKNDSTTALLDVKKTFKKLGTCSRTFFYILNREFGYPKEEEEHAADSLAGGIMKKGYQCGMLWGTSLAVGAEAYRRYDNRGQAIAVAIAATQNLMKSFVQRTSSSDCLDITGCNWSSKLSIVKYFITGKFRNCSNLSEKWAPEAIEAAYEGLSSIPDNLSQPPVSCASEIATKMGASDEERTMVSGFAGGMGLSGNGCGALAATLWLKTLGLYREQGNDKSAIRNQEAENILKAFYDETNQKILCREICGRSFNSINEHSEYIANGGCENLIRVLSLS